MTELDAAQIWNLWRTLPLTRLSLKLPRQPTEDDVLKLTGQLQGSLWTRLCHSLQQGGSRCADAPLNARACASRCTADALFPLDKNGQANFRMARVFARPSAGTPQLDVLVLGPAEPRAMQALSHAAAAWAGDGVSAESTVTTLGERHPWAARRLDLVAATPLNLGRRSRASGMPEATLEDLAQRLRASLASRGYKFMALAHACHPTLAGAPAETSRAACLAARQCALNVLADGLRVVDADLQPDRQLLHSDSTGTRRQPELFRGWVSLQVTEQASPWVALMLTAGVGEGPDEGWGCLIEMQP